MTTEILTFTCSICGEPSHDICIACTKDACRNHRCERCKRCSDCCGCDVPLSAAEAIVETEHPPHVPELEPQPQSAHEPVPEILEERPQPEPDVSQTPSEAIPELFRPDPEPRTE